MARIDDLITLEKAGQLPADMQKDLDTLRAAGQAPAKEGGATAPAEEPASMTKQAAPVAKQPGSDPLGIAGAIDAFTQSPITQGALGGAQYVGDMAKKSAMPMAGQAGGAMLGAPFGPAGVVIGEALGGGVGEMANQIGGITAPSLSEVALAMAAGPATRATLGIARKGIGAAINAFGGRQAVAEVATEVAKKAFGPKVPGDELYDAASKLTGFVPTFRTGKAVGDILANEAGKPSEVSRSIVAAVTPYAGYYETQGLNTTAHGIPQMMTDIQDLRTASSIAYKAGNTRLGKAWDTIRGGLLDDARASGVPELSKAANAWRREMSLDKLSNILSSPNPLSNFDKAVGKTAKDKLFAKEWDATEQASLRKLIQKMTTVAPSGFSGVGGRAILGGIAGYIPNDPLMKAGAMIGGFAIPDLAAKAISTKTGRGVVEKLLTDKAITPAALWTGMAQYVRSQNAEDAQSGDVGNAIKGFLQGKQLSIDDKIKASTIGALMGGTADMLP